ncbi:MAG TPA: OmpA family protein [Longimicrobium sp.]|jgi:outer membrane protein OmpA-like peptidoglycan-associated protein
MTTFTRKLTVLACVGTLGMTGVTGCASLNRTEQGAVIGAGTGGAIGAVIGKQTGSTARGAILGAVLGGAAGAVIGRQMDRQSQELEQSLPDAEVQRVGEGIAVTFASGILFPTNSTQILAAGQNNLAQLASSLQRYPETTVLIVGHTDARGTDQYNMQLSQNRAQSAANFLISRGIAGSRIRTEGRGESEPVASNDTDAGMQQNRRVEIAIFASEQYRQQILREYGTRSQ